MEFDIYSPFVYALTMDENAFTAGVRLTIIALFVALFLALLAESGLAAALVGVLIAAPVLMVLGIIPSLAGGLVLAVIAKLLSHGRPIK